MSTDDPELIRSEAFSELGLLIQRDASILIERWSRRAIEEQPNAKRVHHRALLDHLNDLLQALGQTLMGKDEITTNGHRLPAKIHGEERWETGWSLPEVVRDYQILRLVIVGYLEETLDRQLDYREVMAIGLALDEAITSSVVTYATSRDEHLRQLEEKRAELDRQVQEYLRQKAEALRESDRRKNEFLATLAHELRNPLAPLRNGTGVLHLLSTTDPTVLQIRDVFDRQVQQMARLLDDLLDISRIAQGKVVLQREGVNLATLASQAVQMSEPLVKSRQLHLDVSLPTRDLWLEADPARLAQIIVNLLNNAAKYTGRGGRIWLTIQREAEEAVLRVRDTGDGIAPELLPHIFDLFTQAEWPADRSQGGLGIGLALVRKLVELHGGGITVSSPGLGQGSEFVVRLPALPASVDKRGLIEHDDKPQPLMLRHRILVVDDNTDAAESLALLLQVQGQEVQVAHDGLSALETADKFRPEVVLLDIGLPRLNGYEVARRLRQQPWGSKMLIVALTGYGQDEDRQRSAAAGCNAHLLKPVDLKALSELLVHARHFTGPTIKKL